MGEQNSDLTKTTLREDRETHKGWLSLDLAGRGTLELLEEVLRATLRAHRNGVALPGRAAFR